MPSSALLERLGIAHAIIQAPMAGGMVTPALVAAVSNAGALGSFAAALLAPDAIAAGVAAIRAATDRPFGVNLFVLDPVRPDREAIARSHRLLRPIRDELGLSSDPAPTVYAHDTTAQIDTLVALRVPVATFAFGLLGRDPIARLKAAGSFVIGTATNVAEARAWEANGADAICAQGSEAGGHRGTFLGSHDEGMIGTMALVPQIVDAVQVPVVAAGGIMDGRGIAAALALGASAVQLGTAFLNCREAELVPAYRQALRDARDGQTALTRAFSGRYARGIVNAFMRKLDAVQGELPDYPVQAALTGDIRAAAGRANNADYLSLWAGQAVGLLAMRPPEQPAADLVNALLEEARAATRRSNSKS